MNDFAKDRIIVVINNESSLKFSNYSSEMFSEINCISVQNLTSGMKEKIKSLVDIPKENLNPS